MEIGIIRLKNAEIDLTLIENLILIWDNLNNNSTYLLLDISK
jgi:hypothetical protein